MQRASLRQTRWPAWNALALAGLAASWAGCADRRTSAPKPIPSVLDAGSTPSTDGGQTHEPPFAWEGAPVWNTAGTMAVVYDGNDAIVLVDLETKKRRTVLGLPPATRSAPWLRFVGTDLVVVDEVTRPGPGTDTTGDAQTLYLVSTTDGRLVRTEDLGAAGTLLFYDATKDVVARLLFPSAVGEGRALSAKTAGTLERRGVRQPRKESFPLPPWFDVGFIATGQTFAGGAPRLLAEQNGRCAFAVTKLRHAPGYGDEEQRVAVLDALAESPVPRALAVTIGPSGTGTFSSKGDLAVLHGPAADPVLVRPNGSIRALGRPGEPSDAMEAAGCVAFSEDGSMLAAAADHDSVRWYTVATGRRAGECTSSDEAPPTRKSSPAEQRPAPCESVAHWRTCGVAFARDPRFILDFNDLGDLQEVDTTTGRIGRSIRDSKRREESGPRAVGNESWLTTGTLLPPRFFVTTGPKPSKSTESVVAVYDLATFAPSPIGKEVARASQVAVSPNGRYALVGDVVWKLDTMTAVGRLVAERVVQAK